MSRKTLRTGFGHKGDTEEELAKKPTTYMRQRGTSTTKDRFGDPRYLDKIAWCIDKRCKILGLDEPTRLAISWQDEAQKAGITLEDAQKVYNQMMSSTTKLLRDNYLKANAVEIPDDVLEGEFEESNDDFADIDND